MVHRSTHEIFAVRTRKRRIFQHRSHEMREVAMGLGKGQSACNVETGRRTHREVGEVNQPVAPQRCARVVDAQFLAERDCRGQAKTT